MYTHKNCGGTVFSVQMIQIDCGITLTPEGLSSVGLGKVSRFGKNVEIALRCQRCEKIVIPTEIQVMCLQCGEFHELSELFLVKECGGIYCKNCIAIYYPDPEYHKIGALVAMNKSVK